ncbi:MAG: hypothetical protein EZS28_056593, partial [Streblomastix strix]
MFDFYYQNLRRIIEEEEERRREEDQRRKAQEEMNPQLPQQNVDLKTLFINNLHSDTTEVNLQKKFSIFNITGCKIPRNQQGAIHHGFINFSNEDDARRALKSMNGTLIDGKRIDGSVLEVKIQQNQSSAQIPQLSEISSIIIRN